MLEKRPKFYSILVVVLLLVIGVLSYFSIKVYFNLNNIEQNVFNLYQQMKVTNSKIDVIATVGDDLSEMSKKFSEATKNWEIYQNAEYNFQMKYPHNWGNVFFTVVENAETIKKGLNGDFDKSDNEMDLQIRIRSYDFGNYEQELIYASSEVGNNLQSGSIGECNDDIFYSLKRLNIGEIRNCVVKENILGQKYLVYRYILINNEKVAARGLVAVYPRESYYFLVTLPENDNTDLEYFLQSVAFLK